MICSLILFCSLALAESKTLAVQICLDRAGFSCNTIDGQWGRKSQSALEKYCASRHLRLPPTPDAAYDALFAEEEDLFRIEAVKEADLTACISMPDSPAEKAKLPQMGYGSIVDMFAERGHITRQTLKYLNPGVNWSSPSPGLKLVIPRFPSIEESLAERQSTRTNAKKSPVAAYLHISLSNFEILAYDAKNRLLALFPCSIARNKSNLPTRRELKIVTRIPNPNYTYTPDVTPPGQKASRHIFPPGPRCPVGVAWLGLDLPGYGIHGTPSPETIGRAESHGCFRLSNWNAARLYALCPTGTRVTIIP